MLDNSYSLPTIRARRLEHTVTSRDLDGFFDHVWSVHPLAGIDGSGDRPSSRPRRYGLGERHTFIEGSVGGIRTLSWWPALDLLLAQLRLIAHLLRLVRKEPVAVVRAGDAYYLGLLGWLLSWIGGVPLAVRVSGDYDAIYAATGRPAYPRLLRSRRLEKLIEKSVFARAALVAGATREYAEYAVRNGARPEAVTVFPFGALIDPVHLADPAARPTAFPGNGPYVLCVGRLEPVKHPKDVLDAMAAARSAGCDASLVFVGDGSLRPELEEQASALGLVDRVLFAGDVAQPEVADYLGGAAVIASPITGRALVEAALAGRPIVAYDTDWQSDFLAHGRTGLLVPFRDSAAMGAAIAELVGDPAGARELGEAARSSALEAMDPVRLRAYERDCYVRLLSETG